MPGFDRTGPEGKGPRTGRGLGLSNDKKTDSTQVQKNRNGLLDLIISVLKLFKK